MAKWSKMEKEMATMFTEDLMLEILVRLPVKSLMRCRCVCKAWYRLIKSPNFVGMHLKFSSSKTDLILLHRNIDWNNDILSIHAYDSLNFITKFPKEPRFEISGPCNGLLCRLDKLDNVSKFSLFNPSTGERADLPPSPFPCREYWDPCVQGFGFGFVSNPNDYKVISLVTFCYYEDYNSEHYLHYDISGNQPADKVEIYNLSTDSWRQIECNRRYTIFGDAYGILFNGALHWTAHTDEHIDIITAFNMSTEVFQEMELPNDLIGKNAIKKSLTILNNCLALFAYTYHYFNSKVQFIDIWVMREYGVAQSWTKQVSIGPYSGLKRPLMLWKNKSILLENIRRQLVSCALDTHKIEEFGIRGDWDDMRVMVYQESLVSLKSDRLNEESNRSVY